MKSHSRIAIHAILLICLGWLLSACGSLISSPGEPTSTPSPSPTPTVTAVPTSTLTPTPQPPLAVLLAPAGVDQAYAGDQLQTVLNDIATGAGLHFQVRQQLPVNDLVPALRLVVAVPPDPGLAELVAAAPDTQFLVLGISGLEGAPNLTEIGTAAGQPDQQGFIAGVISAMLSADWRAGVISISDTVEGRSARTGFLNGVEYFCGLCLQAHPPFYDYPMYVELPSSATTPEWQEAANYMVDHMVQTVYVFPGAGGEAMLSVLVDAGVNIISSGAPPPSTSSTWVLSLVSDPLPLIRQQVQGLLDGSLSGGRSLVVPIQFTQVNPAIFTPGKQQLAGKILSDMQLGFIDTGVDLTTGEFRP